MSQPARPNVHSRNSVHANRDWMVHAACRSHPPTITNVRARAEMFFPVRERGRGSERKYRNETIQARNICRQCPVWSDCEEFRARLDIRFGIWAGLSEDDRSDGSGAGD